MSYKKLTRSASNRVIAGICGGLGNYFDIDPLIFRIIFFIFGLTGSGIIAYIILMFVIPSEKNVIDPSSTGINEEWIHNVANEVKESVSKNTKPPVNALSIIIAIVLIALGFFFLFPCFHLRLVLPIALIVCGLLILLFYKKNKTDSYEK
jgi:phage shock protein PspC (stress-responsive transcriptional regulator)